MSVITTTQPPYYAVIFTNLRTEGDLGYGEMSEKMLDLASKQPGFLGVESARDDLGITVSYWRDLESIKQWKNNLSHLSAQQKGREQWYSRYRIRIAKVETEYGM